MKTSIVECRYCHYKFNYEFTRGYSTSALRLGTSRIFRCPKCKRAQRFSLLLLGPDTDLPLHVDGKETAIGGKFWAWIIIPCPALVFLGLAMVLTDSSLAYLFVALAILGVAWPLVMLLTIINRYSLPKKNSAS
ncbi:MAG: hypothetical protein JRN20_06505 [Nitrososphaerota archaeon]|nr:hypothetical protein [Nitrososphaerota archaeon]